MMFKIARVKSCEEADLDRDHLTMDLSEDRGGVWM